MGKRDALFNAYRSTGSFRAACAESGVTRYLGYIMLKKANLLRPIDSVRMGSEASRRGARAEAEFQRLVPKALPANEVIGRCNPVFDFDIHGVTVDVKYSSAINIRGALSYHIHTCAHKDERPDFMAAFFAPEGRTDLEDGYRLFLIPAEFAGTRHVNISLKMLNAGTHAYAEFEVRPEALAGIFDEIAKEDTE